MPEARAREAAMQFNCSVCRLSSTEERSFTLVDLKEQQHKCHTCTLLWDGITAVIGPRCRDVMTDVDIWKRAVDGNGPLIISVRYHQVWNRTLQFYCAKESIVPWPEIGVSSEVGSTGLAGCTIQRAKQWIEACTSCDKAHSGCKLYDENAARLPKRVIHVGFRDGDPVRLQIPPDGEAGRYVALSHCWGGKTPKMTTTDNYEGHIRDISLLLPKTFMDAVLVVRALGVQYLWIDSLCIIQNSSEDWNEQAPLMAAIYGNAYCTLSADAAENTTNGFVEGSRRFRNIPQSIEFKHLGQEGEILVRERERPYPHQPLHDFDTLELSQGLGQDRFRVENAMTYAPYSTLSSRAWVFQERMLSPRTLHFGHAETGWECHSLVDCECSPYNSTDGSFNSNQFSLKAMLDTWPWRNVVQHFSQLGITFPKVRLVALSGLARAHYEVTGDLYVAGLWASKMRDSLLWTVQKEPGKKPPERLDIAPTWSWASISARIVYWQINARHDYPDHKTCCLGWRVLSVSFNEPPGLFGPTIQARITIEGLLVEGIIKDPRVTDDRQNYHIEVLKEEYLSVEHRQSVRSAVYWDTIYDEQPTYTLFVTSHPDDHMQGIILAADVDKSCYKRLGMFDISPYGRGLVDPWIAWKDNTVLQEFHIS